MTVERARLAAVEMQRRREDETTQTDVNVAPDAEAHRRDQLNQWSEVDDNTALEHDDGDPLTRSAPDPRPVSW